VAARRVVHHVRERNRQRLHLPVSIYYCETPLSSP
jgi:hypothetical protein